MKNVIYVFSALSKNDFFKLVITLLLMFAAAYASNYPALLSGQILDKAVDHKSQSIGIFLPLLGLLAMSYVLREIFVIIRKFLIEKLATQLEKRKFFETSNRLYNSNLAALHKERVGILNARINRSVLGLVKFIKLFFMDFLPTIAIAIVAIVLTAGEDLHVTGVILLTFFIALGVTVIQVWTQKDIRLRLLEVKEIFSANLFEVIQSLDYVRVSNGINTEKEKAEKLTEDLRVTEFKHHKWMMSFDAFKQLIEGLGMVLVVAYGAWQVSSGEMTYGTVLTLTMLYNSAALPLRELHKVLDEGMESLLLVDELRRLNEIPQDLYIYGNQWPEINSNSLFSVKNLSLVVEIDGEKKRLIKDISLSIEAGERVAFVGRSGSGKSTVMKCMLGLFPDATGSVQYYGTELRNLNKKKFWQSVGYVSQLPHIVSGTISENVFYGNSSDTNSKDFFEKKLKSVDLQNRFSIVARGKNVSDQMILENGRNLSGGEKQRISIARLFGRELTAIFLDEATSGLDNKSEKLVLENLEADFKHITLISIVHRLETIRAYDKVVVFKDGEVAEVGTYDELLEKQGEFSKIVNARS